MTSEELNEALAVIAENESSQERELELAKLVTNLHQALESTKEELRRTESLRQMVQKWYDELRAVVVAVKLLTKNYE